jgi:hypothetical protein
MDIKISIDDIFDEDGSLSDEIRRAVVAELAGRADKASILALENEARGKLSAMLDAKINSLMEFWMEKQITVTDAFGDTVEQGTLMDVVKRRFDRFWEQKVDSNGRAGSGYTAKGTRLEWLLDKRIEELCKKFSDDMAREVKKQVTSIMTDKLKVAIGGSLIDAIGLPQIIKRLSQ